MNKAVIIYASMHHGNTRRLVEAIADRYDIDKIDATKHQQSDLSEYDLIGFASGVDFGKFYNSVENFLECNLPEGKQVFFLYTCAKVNPRLKKKLKHWLLKKNLLYWVNMDAGVIIHMVLGK